LILGNSNAINGGLGTVVGMVVCNWWIAWLARIWTRTRSLFALVRNFTLS